MVLRRVLKIAGGGETLSFVMSLRRCGATRLALEGFFLLQLNLSIFLKSAEKIHVALKSDDDNGPFI
jgi:hypothetical protein